MYLWVTAVVAMVIERRMVRGMMRGEEKNIKEFKDG
jgi:hypothetical protein